MTVAWVWAFVDQGRYAYAEGIRCVAAPTKKLAHDGNGPRIIIKSEERKSLIDVPPTLGVVGALPHTQSGRYVYRCVEISEANSAPDNGRRP
ncbi:MAG: DUF4342 domain-containing protein [Anaerolineales bacterium]|nr:MAG: DUF4342 domain-containing protein [Anaerolineales bacterium]